MTRGMRTAALAITALTVATTACTTSTGDAEGPSTPDGERATVEWVVDGDTVRLTDGREVRLVQIDAPEASSDCYGWEATRALIDLAKGERVTLERDPALDDEDTYGRLLRYVLVDDRNLNVLLVRDGAASPYFFRNERGRYADALLDAAADARGARVGFWGACPRARLEPGLGSVTGPASSQRR